LAQRSIDGKDKERTKKLGKGRMKRDLKENEGNVEEESEGQKLDEMKTWQKKGKEDQQKDRKEKNERT
jgi:hypothetical protein